MSTDRIEGWGSLINARDAHYFRNGRSLCGRWLALGAPEWEENQKKGPEPKPHTGTCKTCWKRAPEEAP